jgi:hypothetical protein
MDYLKICRAEFDRLIEQSPPIPDKVIHAFEHEFKDKPDLIRPDIAHGMDHTRIFVDKDTRLKQVAAEAAQFLMQKRKVWHRAMMPDVDNHIEKKVASVVADLSGNHFARLQDKIAELERKLEEKEKKGAPSLHHRAFLRPSAPAPQIPPSERPPRRASTLTRSLSPGDLRQMTLNQTIPNSPVNSSSLISALSVSRQAAKPEDIALQLPSAIEEQEEKK